MSRRGDVRGDVGTDETNLSVGVGNGNPAKRRAVEAVFPAVAVVAQTVDSGVSEQPRSHAETIRGAENRARAVLRAGRPDGANVGVEDDRADGAGDEGGTGDEGGEGDDGGDGYDYGVGIEGGVASVDGAEGLFLIMWAAVTDGERLGLGAGPSLRLPDSIADRIRDGEELGPVMDDVLGTDGIKRRGGAASVLTDGRLTREEALADAVRAALGAFVSDLYE